MPFAMGLKVEEQVRTNHDECPAGQDTKRRLYIKRTSTGFLAFCHNCGHHGVVGNGRGVTRAIADLLDKHKDALETGIVSVNGQLELPPECDSVIFRWPDSARAWLYQYGITDQEMMDAGICYSWAWGRVVLPVYEDGKLVYWQARAIDRAQDPKYISAKANPKAMYWHHFHQAVGRTNSIGIVEDILSAIKLGRYMDTVAMLGTSPDMAGLTERLKNYKKVAIVLDPDQAGIRKANELHSRLSLIKPGEVKLIHTSKQPKEMSAEELLTISRGF